MSDAAIVDLRGIPCPLNFVRVKLKLDRLAPGDCLEAWIDAGEPVLQVPPSLEVAGHVIQSLAQQPGGYYRLVVERGAAHCTEATAL